MAQKKPKNGDPNKPLDARERLFVLEYLKELHPERAAVAAGYSKTTAAKKSYSWVGDSGDKPHVAAEIAKAQEKRATKLEITVDRIEAELAKVAFATMRQFIRVDAEGQPRIDLTDTDDDNLDALSEISTELVIERSGRGDDQEITHVRKTKVKLHSKLDALEKLAQRHGFYKERDGARVDAIRSMFEEIWSRGSKAPITKGNA